MYVRHETDRAKIDGPFFTFEEALAHALKCADEDQARYFVVERLVSVEVTERMVLAIAHPDGTVIYLAPAVPLEEMMDVSDPNVADVGDHERLGDRTLNDSRKSDGEHSGAP